MRRRDLTNSPRLQHTERAMPVCHRVQILPAGTVFEVQPGLTILEAALAAGLNWPRSCRSGACRTCMCQIESGRVRYRMEWPGVSPEEKEWGCMLPCVAEPDSDLVLRQV